MSVAVRVVLAVSGSVFVALPLMTDQPDLRGTWVLVLMGVLLLSGAILGREPVPFGRSIVVRSGSYWVLRAEDTPSPAPVMMTVLGALFGGLYSLYYQTWRHVVFAAAAGLIIGLCAPWFRYRLLAFLLITLVVSGFMMGIGFDQVIGGGEVVFLSACCGFVYAALLWGHTRYGLFWWSREG